MVEAFTSLQWQRWFYKAGEFELVCPIPQKDSEALALSNLLKRKNIIWPKGKDEAGYIYYSHPKTDTNGQETLDVKGRFLTGYLRRRIVWDSLYLTGTAENVMRQLVDKNAISPTITGRAIPLLSLGTLYGLTPTGVYQTPTDKRDNLADALEVLATAADVGQRVLFDSKNKAIKYEVWQGIDRTAVQSANPRAIFSAEYENVLTQEYTDSDDDLKNVALVDGKFTYQVTKIETGSDGKTTTETSDATLPVSTTVGDASGLDRYEEYLSSNSSSKIDSGKDGSGNESYTYLSQPDFLSLLSADGSKDLAQHVETQTFDSTINLQGNLQYQKNWDMGDMVTFINKRWGVQTNTRITGVKETYEESGLSLDVTIGNDVPTLIDKIKRAVK